MWNDTIIPGLTERERTLLIQEKEASFMAQPWPLKTTFFVLFVAAVVQGWNQTGTTGANLGWPQELLFNSEPVDPTRPDRSLNHNCVPSGYNKWIFAAVNAMPYLAASMSVNSILEPSDVSWISANSASRGTFLSDSLNEIFFGRRNAILISAMIVFAASIVSALVTDWRLLLGMRALLGIGMGCKAAVVPVFAAEIAPAHLRGEMT
jgi:MFS family permease